MAGRKNPFLLDEDNPELTDEQLAALRPAEAVLPAALYSELTKRKPGQRGPGKKPPKVAVTLRLEPDTLLALQATGPGWQVRVNSILREAVRTLAPRQDDTAAPRSKKRA